jgi:hypothetical protein
MEKLPEKKPIEVKKESIEEQKQKLLQNSEVSLILDVYDDIFSDFDPRPYSQRSLSYDFIDEAKRAIRDLPSGQIQLKFLIPYKLRNIPTESMIKKRLKEHFSKHFIEHKKNVRKTKVRGGIMAFTGIAMIFIASALNSDYYTGFIPRFLQTLLEPAGWFTAWVGLEHAFESLAEESQTTKFYEKMAKAEMTFIGY